MHVAAAYQPDMEQVRLDDVPIHWMPVDELFTAADVVTLHCPLTDQTRHLVNAERLERMKPLAYLINTGRGQLVDEAALLDALSQGRIAGPDWMCCPSSRRPATSAGPRLARW
jgi:lactate dehydrogenase-like 2-hydroxyacid dehydrogenase